MKRLILALILVAAAFYLAGCSPTYSHPRFSEEQWNRDVFECQYASQSLPRTPQSMYRGAMGVPVYSDPSLGWFDAANSRRMLDLCMKSRGYTRE